MTGLKLACHGAPRQPGQGSRQPQLDGYHWELPALPRYP